MKHEHKEIKDCEHKGLEHCKKCDVVECLECGKEWKGTAPDSGFIWGNSIIDSIMDRCKICGHWFNINFPHNCERPLKCAN